METAKNERMKQGAETELQSTKGVSDNRMQK